MEQFCLCEQECEWAQKYQERKAATFRVLKLLSAETCVIKQPLLPVT